MNTALDKVKSSITISLGLKNRLRDAKGSASYEAFIAQLLRIQSHEIHKDNYLEIQKFQRKEKVYSFNTVKIIFSYNHYEPSQNFIFDIQIKTIREKGQLISLSTFFATLLGNGQLRTSYKLYFDLLTFAIQSEIEPLFSHHGRFEDYNLWLKEFTLLGLSSKTFENDVMEKLINYKNGVSMND